MRNRKIIFLFLNQNICCGYWKEPSQWDVFWAPITYAKIIYGYENIYQFTLKCFIYVSETSWEEEGGSEPWSVSAVPLIVEALITVRAHSLAWNLSIYICLRQFLRTSIWIRLRELHSCAFKRTLALTYANPSDIDHRGALFGYSLFLMWGNSYISPNNRPEHR